MKNVNSHQGRAHTKVEIEKFRKRRVTHCACGARRVKAPGKDYNECTKCKRIWCTMRDCIINCANLRSFNQHKKNCSFVKTEFFDKCSTCGYSPKIRNQLVGNCPKCKSFWCLSSVCSFESDTLDSMNRHLAMVHLIF